MQRASRSSVSATPATSLSRCFVASILIAQLALPGAALAQQAGQQKSAAPQQEMTEQQQASQMAMNRAAAEDAAAAGEGSDAGDASMRPAAPKAPLAPLSMDQKYLLVLDRFTYGPRPGDLDKLRALGIQAWFKQQLNPETINDSALDERLAAFPAMKMPLDQLIAVYPTGEEIKRAAAGRGGMGGGTGAHGAVYNEQIERYKDYHKSQNAQAAKPAPPKPAQTSPDQMNAGQMAPGLMNPDSMNPGQQNPPQQAQAKKKGAHAYAEIASATLPMTPEQLLALSPKDRFKELCRFNFAEFAKFRHNLTEDQRSRLTQGMSPQQIETLDAFSSPEGLVRAEDIETKLIRDVYSQRQLEEVMVDFWLNHFNVYMKKSRDAPYYISAYERDAIRPHAMGKFETLLVATATSPAMLNYLDNSSSIGPHSDYAQSSASDYSLRGGVPGGKKSAGLNENYAREVMELHTVGVNGGYTQHDVTEVAKVFTGWTVGKSLMGGDGYEKTQPEFDASKHEPGDKMVLGHKIKSGGQKEGMEVLHLLATSPQTAHFVSTKLAVRFVSDNPPPAMVDAMAATFLSTGGDIRRVLITMVNSPDFFAPETYRAKVKTPQDYVLSAVRAANSNVQSATGLAAAIDELGMPVYGHQTPDGYSMRADAWNNTAALVSRMNFAMALSTNRVEGVSTDFNALLGAKNEDELTGAQKEAALQDHMLHVPLSAHTKDLILSQVEGDPNEQAANLRQINHVVQKKDALAMTHSEGVRTRGEVDNEASLAAGLLLGSPEFQRR